MNSILLYDYQQEMLDRLMKAWKRHRSVMVQMPTGTGKTHLMAEAIRQCIVSSDNFRGVKGVKEVKGVKANSLADTKHSSLNTNNFILIVAHRRELLEQIRNTLDAFGLTGENVRVESIQKLSRHIDEECCSPSLVVIDEAHHALAKTYRVLWEKWYKAKFLGLTATPCRMNGAAFTDLFDVLLQSWSIQTFIDKGWLSDFEYVSASPDSQVMKQIRSLKKRGADGDYQTKELVAVMDVPDSIEHLYNTYRQFACGRKGIVYAIDREHARHIVDYYSEHDVNCAMIDAKTLAKERLRIVEDYREKKIDVLVNVDIFSEGFDCPEVEFIQLARPTLSLSKYLQQVGRGMRISEGKSQVLILDNVGLYQQFGLPTADRDWQQLFLGREAGKAAQGMSRCVVVDDEKQDKELVNLEMVRIKSGGERRTGLEVFLQDGRYGVMRNGRITCPARFKKVKRLQEDCGFFALGVYMKRNEHNFGRLEEVTTVIDRYGQDLNVTLYGTVLWCNGYFYGRSVGANYIENSWDPVGNSYYDYHPCFTKVAGVEVGFSVEHGAPTVSCMKLRLSTGNVSPRFNLREMFYNRDIIIARDYLVVKKDKNHSYRIKGYLGDSVLVECEERYGYQQIMLNGKKGQFYSSMPNESTHIFNAMQLRLQRVHPENIFSV
ncbi:MAG: DEAD/DEAH box helicase [Prevotella sp.]|nr:DEAD/DEAH box helicase [Prevotella sp.]